MIIGKPYGLKGALRKPAQHTSKVGQQQSTNKMVALALLIQPAALMHQEVWNGRVEQCTYTLGYPTKIFYKGKKVWSSWVDTKDYELMNWHAGHKVIDSPTSHRFFVRLNTGTDVFSSEGKWLYSMPGGERAPYPFFISSKGVVINGWNNMNYTYPRKTSDIDWHDGEQKTSVFDPTGSETVLPSLKVIGFPFYATKKYAYSFRPVNWEETFKLKHSMLFWLQKYDLINRKVSKVRFRLSKKNSEIAVELITYEAEATCYYNEKKHVISVGPHRDGLRLRVPNLHVLDGVH